MAHQLLSELDTEGVISRHLQPLLDRIHQMLGPERGRRQGADAARAHHQPGQAPGAGPLLRAVAEALLKRRRLHLRYLTRGRAR
jgi:hypothetical protein